jgi:MoxR-like ATPase
MKRIIAVHHPRLDEKLVDQALSAFYRVRATPGLRKRPSTSELIDWIAVLRRANSDAARLEEKLPFLGTLLKKEQDHELLGKRGK